MQGLTLRGFFAYSVLYPVLDLPTEGTLTFPPAFDRSLIQD